VNDRQRRLEQRRAWDDDDIETRRMAVPTEDLANESLGPVALDGAPELPGGRDAEPGDVTATGQDEHGHEPAPLTRPLLVHLLEVCAPPDVLSRAEPLVHDSRTAAVKRV
jgi:hypothetical protein